MVYDELIRQGWSEADALLVSRRPKSLPYAQARLAATSREFLRVCVREFNVATTKIENSFKVFTKSVRARSGKKP